jgi:hypothetical protein
LFLLPVAHRHVIEVLLDFLSKVAEHAGDPTALAAAATATSPTEVDAKEAAAAAKAGGGNLMDAGNLATVIGPNILREKTGSDPGNINVAAKELEHSNAVSNIVKILIERNKDLWFVSNLMAAQPISVIGHRVRPLSIQIANSFCDHARFFSKIPPDIEEEVKATLDADRMLNARKVKKGSNGYVMKVPGH